jgi:hypothetical protein
MGASSKNQESATGMGRGATSKPAPFASGAKGCGTRKIFVAPLRWKGEPPARRGVINGGELSCEKVGHPRAAPPFTSMYEYYCGFLCLLRA